MRAAVGAEAVDAAVAFVRALEEHLVAAHLENPADTGVPLVSSSIEHRISRLTVTGKNTLLAGIEPLSEEDREAQRKLYVEVRDKQSERPETPH
jgi:hypothetical protein